MTKMSNNPYVGPRTFLDTDADRLRYFGRDEEADTLLSLVLMHRLVLFYASSGAGKSSLINARLKPALRDENFTVLPTGRVSGSGLPETATGNVFVFNLLSHLEPAAHPNTLIGLTLTEYLQQRPRPPTTDDADFEPARILIIDQFEEIVNAQREYWEQRTAFFEQVAQAMADDPLLWVLLVMRDDYVASIEPYAHLLPNKLRVRYQMQRMHEEAALEAIQQPAHRFGHTFTDDAAHKLVNDLRQIRVPNQEGTVAGEFVEPVQLQVVCYELWEHLQPVTSESITGADVQILADVDRTLGDYYSRVVEQVARRTQISERKLRQWFEAQLITEADTRNAVFRGERATSGLPNQAIDLLTNDFFILRSDTRSGGIWYELIHDRFMPAIRKSNEQENVKITRQRIRLTITFLSLLLSVATILLGESLFTRYSQEVGSINTAEAIIVQAQTADASATIVSVQETIDVQTAEVRFATLTVDAENRDAIATREEGDRLATDEARRAEANAELIATSVAAAATIAQQTVEAGSDNDGDGLTWIDEKQIYFTDPDKFDTDGDGLSDYDEVGRCTDPRNPDTDTDELLDGEEVLTYQTNPCRADSDNDGILDSVDTSPRSTPPSTPGSIPTVPTPVIITVVPSAQTPLDTNLLLNPSFEAHSYLQGDVQEYQLPYGWQLIDIYDNQDSAYNFTYSKPEVRNLSKGDFPEEEQDIFFFDGNKLVKIFKGGSPMRASFVTTDTLTLSTGSYIFRVGIYADIVAHYDDSGSKQFSTDPDAARIRPIIGSIKTDFQEVPKGGGEAFYISFPFEVDSFFVGLIGIELDAPLLQANNGWYLDDWSLVRTR